MPQTLSSFCRQTLTEVVVFAQFCRHAEAECCMRSHAGGDLAAQCVCIREAILNHRKGPFMFRCTLLFRITGPSSEGLVLSNFSARPCLTTQKFSRMEASRRSGFSLWAFPGLALASWLGLGDRIRGFRIYGSSFRT